MTVIKRRERGVQGNLLSFLDVISSGFGAIVMLLVITKTVEPIREIEARSQLQARAAALAETTPALEQQVEQLEAQLQQADAQLALVDQQLDELQDTVARQNPDAGGDLDQRSLTIVSQRLNQAKQSLSEEMQRLLAGRQRQDSTVGGIPVDSEYIIFIIDTSGSMRRAWPLVTRKLTEVLDIYPQVKGLQIMSDMGDFMFEKTAGLWIPDTPSRRAAILRRIYTWQPFSNSSPVEGIQRAIAEYASRDRRVSLYVFGDEFSGNSIQPVLNRVRQLNPRNSAGQSLVRIHAIGFPTQFARRGISVTGARFALLMRELTAENDGTFVGLVPDQQYGNTLL
ncbi:MAG: hypothetical protein Tsb002_34400 [Wenzhouxiangellaceae bacterium]